jgi:4-amino-4-deoxy-L-arabinose transferase-like glycosyltransferase
MTATDTRTPGRAIPLPVAAPPNPPDRTWWWPAGLAAVLVVAATLRVWDAAATSGVGNSYYAAAALSMSRDWDAFLTGALDTGVFVSLDKPAPWLWPSALLIKAFGLNWATLFLPSAVAGVLAVLVLALAVREGFGDGARARAAGLLAAAGLAVSPLNVAVDRNNNPDAIMLCALLVAAWLTLRAARRGALLPLAGAGAAVGVAFNAKYVQAYMVLVGLLLAWILGTAAPLRRRIAGLAVAAGPLVAVSAVWPVTVALLPAAGRPWIAGTTDGTILTRLTSIVDIHLAPPLIPGGPMAPLVNAFLSGEVFHAGPAGKSRLLSGVLADQVSWWLPLAAVAALVVAVGGRALGTAAPHRAGLLLWVGWALPCWALFSFMSGVLHPYYTSMLGPAVAALAATGLVTSWALWREGSPYGLVALVTQTVLVTGWTVFVLAGTDAPHPGWLAAVVLGAGALATAGTVLARSPRARAGVAAAIAVAALAAPVVWSVATARQPLQGGNPLANQEGRYRPALLPDPVADAFMAQLEPRIDPRLVAHLVAEHDGERWAAATLTAMAASPLIIALDGGAVMALGGYDGRDPMPTPERFRESVRAGLVRFVVTPPTADGTTAFVDGPPVEVLRWARAACTPVDYGAGPAAADGSQLLDCRGA